jgi:hypothetical protein
VKPIQSRVLGHVWATFHSHTTFHNAAPTQPPSLPGCHCPWAALMRGAPLAAVWWRMPPAVAAHPLIQPIIFSSVERGSWPKAISWRRKLARHLLTGWRRARSKLPGRRQLSCPTISHVWPPPHHSKSAACQGASLPPWLSFFLGLGWYHLLYLTSSRNLNGRTYWNNV